MTQALKDFHNQIMGLVALIVLVAGFVLCPQERLDHIGSALVAFGSTPAGQTIYAALLALVVAAFRWALSRIPAQLRSETTVTVAQSGPVKVPPSKEDGSSPPSAIFLAASVGCAVVLAAGYLHGCGGAATTVPAVIGGAQIVVAGVCTGAEKLCEANDPACGSGACHAFHNVCPVLSPSSPVQIACNVPDAVVALPVTTAGQ